jgi:hypothetical protein
MVRRLILVAVCLGLAGGGVACAPPRLGPTAGSGYVFSVQVSDSIVWRGPVNPAVAARFPQVAEVLVTVQDTQGRPVDDVPVTFELEPGWARSATLTPAATRTRGGRARAFFSEAQTTGVVRMMVRVDGTTAQVHLTVLSYQEPSDSPDVP